MTEISALIDLLEKSIEKNGADKVLTLGHLLNILKLLERKRDEEEAKIDAMESFDLCDWGDQ
jgi:hypothetical protein